MGELRRGALEAERSSLSCFSVALGAYQPLREEEEEEKEEEEQEEEDEEEEEAFLSCLSM